MNFDDNTSALQVIRFINGTNRSIFLTGKAGTGKTTLLKEFVEHTHKSVVIVAPTGIAALNAGGVTIHSMFQIPPACYAPALDFENPNISFSVMPLRKIPREVSKMAGWKRNVLRKMDLLVIDEVSMLRADLLDAIDVALQSIRRRKNVPFGGVQVLFIGDMLQLPPVVKNDEWNFLKQYYNSMYFFDARVLQYEQPLVLELEKIYRQDDKRFIEILNNLRANKFVQSDVNELNKHYIPHFEAPKKEPYIFITTHNKKAEKINDDRLKKLKGESLFYKSEINGNFPENLFPLNPILELKVGAQIMFIKNDSQQGESYYNGKIGEICELDDENIKVIFPETGRKVIVEKFQWENIRYTLDKATGQIQEEVLGTFVAYPIKLAWAVTVHKSQGLTFKRAIIDVSEAFAPGQIYVALSRLESLQGLVLSEPIVDDFPDQDKRVLKFANDKKSDSELDDLYKVAMQKYVEDTILSAFDFHSLLEDFNAHMADYEVDETHSNKILFKKQIEDLSPKVQNMVQIADKFQLQLNFIISKRDNNYLLQRLSASLQYFTPLFDEISLQIYKVIANALVATRTKQYVADLQTLELLFFNTLQQIRKAEKLLKSILSGGHISKEELLVDVDLEARNKVMMQQATAKKTNEKAQKYIDRHLETKEVSYMMYINGMTPDEIAEDRALTVKTIYRHLQYFVAEGDLDVSQFVDEQTIKNVVAVVKEKDLKTLTAIKAELPDVSYEDIRFVLAAMEGGM